MPGLYSDRAPAEIASGVTLLASATITISSVDYDLTVDKWSLTIDETMLPHARLTLVCQIPDDDLLDLIDPRLTQYVNLSAGYMYGDGTEDVQDFAHLALESRTVDKPAGTMTLIATSAEQLVEDANVPVDEGWLTFATVADAEEMIDIFVPVTLNSTIPAGTIPPAEYPLTFNTTDVIDENGYIRAVADSVGAVTYCDQMYVWQLHPAPTLGAAEAILTTGAGGTITKIEDRLSREGWANVVISTYDSVPDLWSKESDVRSGEVTKVHHERRSHPPLNYTATSEMEIEDGANAGMLERLRGRGQQLTVTTIAHLWLRVHDTITVNGDRTLIAAITTTEDGRQVIRTRKPD